MDFLGGFESMSLNDLNNDLDDIANFKLALKIY